jgi:tRNA(Ile)-lysidine synthase
LGDSEKWHVPEVLREKFKAAGAEQGWLEGEESLVLGISGGSDSVALVFLAFLLLPRERLVMAHFEHGIRGEVSLEDARFVQSFAKTLGLSLECRHVITEEHRNLHESLESTARRIRYDFLREISRKYHNAWIATGHTRNDVQETVLFNLFRGTGIRGLGGIPPRRGRIVRPLLHCSREELRHFLRENGLSWKEDATNEDTSYTRNYIRKILIPQIEEHINARAGEHLANLASDIHVIRTRDEAFYGELVSRMRRKMPLSLVSWDLLSARKLSSWDLRMALMEEARLLNIPPLSRKRLEKLEKLIRTSGRWRFQWKGKVELLCGSKLLSWVDVGEHHPLCSREISLERRGFYEGMHGSWSFKAEKTSLLSGEKEMLESGEAWIGLGKSEIIGICSLEEWEKKKGKGKTEPPWQNVPWWARPLWPVILWGEKGFWVPRMGWGEPDSSSTASFSEENHVTMARLLCCPSVTSLWKEGTECGEN